MSRIILGLPAIQEKQIGVDNRITRVRIGNQYQAVLPKCTRNFSENSMNKYLGEILSPEDVEKEIKKPFTPWKKEDLE